MENDKQPKKQLDVHKLSNMVQMGVAATVFAGTVMAGAYVGHLLDKDYQTEDKINAQYETQTKIDLQEFNNEFAKIKAMGIIPENITLEMAQEAYLNATQEQRITAIKAKARSHDGAIILGLFSIIPATLLAYGCSHNARLKSYEILHKINYHRTKFNEKLCFDKLHLNNAKKLPEPKGKTL